MPPRASVKMGRMPKAADRLPSQRPSRQEQEEEATSAELKRQLDRLQRELIRVMAQRAAAERKVRSLQAAPPPVPKATRTIKKIKSKTTFYEHVEELCVFLRAFDGLDVTQHALDTSGWTNVAGIRLALAPLLERATARRDVVVVEVGAWRGGSACRRATSP